MPDIHMELVPWPPATTVTVYQRKSELMLADSPPPQVPALASAAVAPDSSLTYNGMDPGSYWAIAPLDGVYRYLAFDLEVPLDEARMRAVEAQTASLDTRVSANEVELSSQDLRLDAVEAATSSVDYEALSAEVADLTSEVVNIDGELIAINDRADLSSQALNTNLQGITAPSNRGWAAGSLAFTGARAYFARFVCARNMTARRIRFYLETVAGSNTGVDVGLYADAGDPTQHLYRWVSSGVVLGKMQLSGPVDVPIAPFNLVAGNAYYAAIAFATPSGTPVVTSAFGAAINSLYNLKLDLLYRNNTYPLPDDVASPGVLFGGTNQAPVLAVME